MKIWPQQLDTQLQASMTRFQVQGLSAAVAAPGPSAFSWWLCRCHECATAWRIGVLL